jgi:2-methylcitrate dehydratase PrpD
MSEPVLAREPDPMSILCKMVVDTKYGDLPNNVVDYAKKCVLDTMAVTVGGSAMESVAEVVNFVKDKGGKPESIIPFYGGRVPASEAAFAIAPMTRAMDMGDAHTEGGHCSEYILPALLAATGLKDKVSGKEFITALVVGQEMLVRIGVAFGVVSRGIPAGQIGGHYIFGCIASVGKLLGLSLEELENAEGIGRGMTQPHDVAMLAPPSSMVRVHHSFVAQDAINACLLARRGITGPRGDVSDVLAGPKGYLAFAHWPTKPELMTRGLGEEWEMLNIGMKPNPACGCTHTSIEGILEQMEEHHFEVGDIAAIELDVSPVIWTAVCLPKEERWHPQTVPECQFSLAYTVATAAFDKDVFLNSYTPEARARQDVRELMTRISARQDPDLPSFGVRVNTSLKDGRQFSKDCPYSKGQPMKPFTEQELVKRFKKCVPYAACKLDDAAVDSVIKAILDLENNEDVMGSLLVPLTPK